MDQINHFFFSHRPKFLLLTKKILWNYQNFSVIKRISQVNSVIIAKNMD